jgi:Leucine-rich repeat (LRR) protein
MILKIDILKCLFHIHLLILKTLVVWETKDYIDWVAKGCPVNKKNQQLKLKTIKSLTPMIYNLTNLQVLEITTISTLPSTIGNCKSLNVLYLSNNQLTELPSEIGLLKNLEVTNNNLTEIPLELVHCRQLQRLFCRKNKITFEMDFQNYLTSHLVTFIS